VQLVRRGFQTPAEIELNIDVRLHRVMGTDTGTLQIDSSRMSYFGSQTPVIGFPRGCREMKTTYGAVWPSKGSGLQNGSSFYDPQNDCQSIRAKRTLGWMTPDGSCVAGTPPQGSGWSPDPKPSRKLFFSAPIPARD
jgi:hypothetical protein